MLQQLGSVLEPLGEHVATAETVTAEALHYAMAVVTVSGGEEIRDYSETYIFNISIGSGSTRLS